MKLSSLPPDRIVVEGVELEIYVAIDEPPPAQVYLDVLVHCDDENGKLTRVDLHQQLPCVAVPLRPGDPPGSHGLMVKWTASFASTPQIAGRTARTVYDVRWSSAKTGKIEKRRSPDWHCVVAIDITTQPSLTRIMLHEFATRERQSDNDIRSVFDPSEVQAHLATLTLQQRKVLLQSALAHPGGRLVTFITLYPRKDLRMHADWCDASGTGVVPNATFTVFHCRDEARSGGTTPKSISSVTLVCHTRYYCVNLVNRPTLDFITKRVFDGRKPNEWLSKAGERPVLFKIAALEPSSMCDGVIWNIFLEAATGVNIMPGNSQHGLINTKGCWMLFRNFNWPLHYVDELDRIYRRVDRGGRGKAAVIAELAKAHYDIKAGSEPPNNSTSYDKFIKFDRNWAYLWFFHEVVGIKYFADVFWSYGHPVNDYNVHGHDRAKSFPLYEAGRTPSYNAGDESTYAYHDFDHRKLPIGSGLVRENAMGFKTAKSFAKSMHAKLSAGELADCAWADVYFYKEDGVDAERLTAASITEP